MEEGLGRPALPEFNVQDLEAYVIREAERRGDRLYRIILTPFEPSPFPARRLSLDLARMEYDFNVVRVCPEPGAARELPGKVVYFITTMMPFERAAALAASRLIGSVDIAEIPYPAWTEESARWTAEHCAPRSPRRDQAKADMAMLVLSYKILRFDMERILAAVSESADGLETVQARGSMGRFESRLAAFQDGGLSFLCFEQGGRRRYVPRFMVRGFAFDHGDSRRYWPASFGGDDAAAAEVGGEARFSVILGAQDGAGAFAAEADRLVSYGDIPLSGIRIVGRVSKDLFEADFGDNRALLLLPDFSRD